MKTNTSTKEQATPAEINCPVTALSIAAWLESEAHRLSKVHGVFVNHIGTGYTAGCVGTDLAFSVQSQGECEFGSSPDEAMKRLLPRLQNPAALAARKREQAKRIMEEANAIEQAHLTQSK